MEESVHDLLAMRRPVTELRFYITDDWVGVIIDFMPHIKCVRCSSLFYAKPRHIMVGWGKFCSRRCQSESQKNGSYVKCATCKGLIYRTPKHFRHSRSGNFFCDKSCLAVWKNKHIISGENHPSWKHGENAYRNIMLRRKIKSTCSDCKIIDFRVLLVHHKDRIVKIIELIICSGCATIVTSLNT